MSSPPPPSSDLGAFAVLARSMRVYLANANTLLLIVSLFLVPATIAVVVLLHFTLPERILTLDTSSTDNPFADMTSAEIRAFVAAALIGGLVNLVTTMVAIGASFTAVGDALTGVKPSWRTSVRAAMHKAGSLMWIPILMALLFFGTGLLILVVIAIASAIGELVAVPVAVAAFAGGAYFFVRWSLAVPALMAEDERGTAALSRSAALIRGRWWPVFGIYVLTLVVMIVVSAAIGAVFKNPDPDTGRALVIPTLGSIITSVLVTPFQTAVLAVVYFNLRAQDSQALDNEVDSPG